MADVRSSGGEHVNKCLNNLGFATCTADPTLNVHRESEVRSTHVDDGCAVGLQPALNRMLSSSEAMSAIRRSGSVTVRQEVSMLGGNVERTACAFTSKLPPLNCQLSQRHMRLQTQTRIQDTSHRISFFARAGYSRLGAYPPCGAIFGMDW